jgi:hypothetical protein
LKNIILIGIDSLRFDRTRLGGYKYDICPNINMLADNGIACSNAVTPSGPTQFAFPSIYTSTLPLDYGGYDYGIKYRPNSITKILRSYDYNTFGFATNFWISEFGNYNDGFNKYINAFDIETIWSNSGLYLQYYIELYDKKLIDIEKYVLLSSQFSDRVLSLIKAYCEQMIISPDSNYHIDIYRYNYTSLLESINKEIRKLNDDPKSFVFSRSHLLTDFEAFIKANNSEIFNNGIIGLISKIPYNNSVKHGLRMKRFFYKNYISSKLLIEKSINWIKENNNTTSPFFMSIFIDDVHDLISSVGIGNSYRKNINKLLMSAGISKEYKHYLHFLRSYRKDTLDLQYDASVKFVDNSIGYLIDYLKRTGLIQNTIIGIYADHGMGLNKNKNRSLVASFYDDYIKIPLIFYQHELPPRLVSNTSSLIDIAPTILDLISVSSPSHFKGRSLVSNIDSFEKYSIHENLSRGPCDFERKRIDIAIRTEEYKYIFQESSKCSLPELIGLYDLKNDPNEKFNINKEYDVCVPVRMYQNIAKKRIDNIKSEHNQIK